MWRMTWKGNTLNFATILPLGYTISFIYPYENQQQLTVRDWKQGMIEKEKKMKLK